MIHLISTVPIEVHIIFVDEAETSMYLERDESDHQNACIGETSACCYHCRQQQQQQQPLASRLLSCW